MHLAWLRQRQEGIKRESCRPEGGGGVDTADKGYFQQATVQKGYETHGSEDVGEF